MIRCATSSASRWCTTKCAVRSMTTRTPSCHIYDDHYHCFACGAHGDAISWLMEVEGLSFTCRAGRARLLGTTAAVGRRARRRRQDAGARAEAMGCGAADRRHPRRWTISRSGTSTLTNCRAARRRCCAFIPTARSTARRSCTRACWRCFRTSTPTPSPASTASR